MWDKRLIEKIEVYVGEFVLAYSFRSIADDFSLAFVGVYGPCNDTIRRSLWVELAGLLGGSCLGSPKCRFVGIFFDFISEQGLMDLPLAVRVVYVV